MNFDKVTEAMNMCEQMLNRAVAAKFPLPLDAQFEHCLDMIRRFREFTPDRIEKAFRWLGFIQGVLYAHGLATVDELKNMNRPYE
jgi:hypothetical protein